MVELITTWMGTGQVNEVVNGEVVNISRYIANGHTTFNVVNAMVFLIFLPFLVKVAIALSPKQGEEEDAFRLPKFDNRFVDNPIAALAQVRGEVIRMSQAAEVTLRNTLRCLETKDQKKLSKWRWYENHLDSMQTAIITYLTKIFQADVNDSEAKEISSLIRMTNNIERIGDSVENIAIRTEDIAEEKIRFTPYALSDLKKISSLVTEFLNLVTEGMRHMPDNFMQRSQSLEDDIDVTREEMRQEHITRLRSGTCANEAGLVFTDMLSDFEKIGDYCYNIAQAVAGIK